MTPFSAGAPRGHRLSGTRWEIYGPDNDDLAQQRAQVYWLLS
jgi:hypothetical protein